MNIHKNARLTLARRLELVLESNLILEDPLLKPNTSLLQRKAAQLEPQVL